MFPVCLLGFAGTALFARRIVEVLLAILTKRGHADFQAVFPAELLDVVQGEALRDQYGDSRLHSVEHLAKTSGKTAVLPLREGLGGADDRLGGLSCHAWTPCKCCLPPTNPCGNFIHPAIIA